MRRLLLGVWAMTAAAQVPAPVLDGKLDDSFWKTVPAAKLAPLEEGVPADNGGEVRLLVRGRYVLIAARLPEPSGRVTARMTGLNPDWEDEDLLRVTVGPDIGYTDRVIKVNPFGARSIEREGQSVFLNADRYLIATSIGEKEWTVEMAVPLNELSAPGPEPVLATVERFRAMRPGTPQQRWRWPRYEPATKLAVDPRVPWEAPAPQFRPQSLGNREAPIEAGRVSVLPPLASGWDHEAWRTAPPLELLRDEALPRSARVPTAVRLLHDGKNLAVLARCTEPNGIVAQVKEHDGRVEADDSFQIYFGTSGSAYAEIVVNALGALLDVAGKTGGPRISRPRADWESHAEVSVRREPGTWTVRLNVPLESVANILGETSIPAEFRVLLMRNRPGRDGQPLEVSVLPAIQSPTALCPIRYRRLRLLPGPAAAHAAAGEQNALGSLDANVFPAAERKELALSGMVERHLRGRVLKALEAERAAWERVQTREDWERFRDQRMQGLKRYIGEFPARPPLRTIVGKEYTGDGYRRLDIAYQSRTDFWVTANLYLPVKSAARIPGIVIVHSHHRPRVQAELQDMGILWARSGAAVLVPDQIAHGERIGSYLWNRDAYHWREIASMQLELAGESLMKWMVWDTLRAVDLLLARSDVDPNKIILLGAVAGGGDPAAVAAALDPRISAVAPFNFGEATPRTGGRGRWPIGLPDPGWGSWDTVRNLPHSIADGFLPWVICASVAPRRLVYSYEMGWDVEQQPAWARYKKIFDFYGARENLDEAHGFGTFPGPGECSNIGPSQRKTLYPELKRWFGIAIPETEPNDRRPEAELTAVTAGTAAGIKRRQVHEIARELAAGKLEAARTQITALPAERRREWLRTRWAARLGDIEPNRNAAAKTIWTKQAGRTAVEGVRLEVEPGITVPLLLLRPAGAAGRLPVVVGISQSGKDAFLSHRAAELEKLLAAGFSMCLPDVRGTGETAADTRRTQSSADISLAATELMLGKTMVGARLKDLRTVLAYLATRQDLDPESIHLWGDSFAAVNPRRLLLDESPAWRLGPEIQHQAEPLGGLLALLGSLYEDRVRSVAVVRGLAGYLRILDDRFAYVPADAMVPGILAAGDIDDVIANVPVRRVLLESLVDGKDSAVPEAELRAQLDGLCKRYHTDPGRIALVPSAALALRAEVAQR